MSFYRLKLVSRIIAVPGDAPPRDGMTVTYVEGDLNGTRAVRIASARSPEVTRVATMASRWRLRSSTKVSTASSYDYPLPAVRDGMIARCLPTAGLLARIIPGRFVDKIPLPGSDLRAQRRAKPETFCFLGYTCICVKTALGKLPIATRTMKRGMRDQHDV